MLDINEIQKIIPQRAPFLMIDKVEEYIPGESAVAYKIVNINEWYFQGHFPEKPIMPGVLITESLAQTGAIAILSMEENKGKNALFGGKMTIKKYYKLGFRVLVIVLINILILAMIQSSTYALSKIGSQGEQVRQIQTALIEKGYLSGSVDGIFGTQTQTALINFQKDYGLTADGIAGTNTLASLGISSESSNSSGGYGSFTESEFNLLARIISAEARGEPYEGQVAVGAVIMNRIEHPSFPDTLSGVIYQSGAFSCLYDGGINAEVADSAYQAAREAINGSDPSGGAIYYYYPVKSTNQWIFSRQVITVIGEHRFAI